MKRKIEIIEHEATASGCFGPEEVTFERPEESLGVLCVEKEKKGARW